MATGAWRFSRGCKNITYKGGELRNYRKYGSSIINTIVYYRISLVVWPITCSTCIQYVSNVLSYVSNVLSYDLNANYRMQELYYYTIVSQLNQVTLDVALRQSSLMDMHIIIQHTI